MKNLQSNLETVSNVISAVASRVVIHPVHSLNSACFSQSFRRPKHAVKSISKRINNLRNEDIKFAERPPHANRVERKKCPRPQPSLSNFWFLNGFERERRCGVDQGLRGSEREGVSSCVRLSESVPAFAIKSGRGCGGGARAKMLFTGGWGFVCRGRFRSDYSTIRLSLACERHSSVAQCRGSRQLASDSRVSERNDSDSAVTALFHS